MRTLRSMPPLPDVAARVMAIVGTQEYAMTDLVAVVKTDPALTTRILKLCNSSLFGLAREVNSVSEAVTYIGSRNLVKLVLVTCTGSYFRNLPQNDYADPAQMWQQTLACSTACQALAERVRYPQPSAAFTAGILHNIGRIALLQVLDPSVLAMAARELVDTTAQPLEVERRIFGIDHAEASGIVTDAWNLPMELRRAVRNHHDDVHIASDDPLTALLHTADELVMSLGLGDPQPLRPHTPSAAAMQRLALGMDELQTVGQLVETELARVGKLLNPEPALSR
ncbi:MAG: HDOD domain-containing protein [Planctomycetota bacterium]